MLPPFCYFAILSAKGAKYYSQGQAPSGARRVAPGYQRERERERERALKVRNIIGSYAALSELHAHFVFYPGATRLATLGSCPWLSYFAPSALCI